MAEIASVFTFIGDCGTLLLLHACDQTSQYSLSSRPLAQSPHFTQTSSCTIIIFIRSVVLSNDFNVAFALVMTTNCVPRHSGCSASRRPLFLILVRLHPRFARRVLNERSVLNLLKACLLALSTRTKSCKARIHVPQMCTAISHGSRELG